MTKLEILIHFVYCGVFKCRCKDASAWTSAVNQIHWGIWSTKKKMSMHLNMYQINMQRAAQITKVTFHGKLFWFYDCQCGDFHLINNMRIDVLLKCYLCQLILCQYQCLMDRGCTEFKQRFVYCKINFLLSTFSLK